MVLPARAIALLLVALTISVTAPDPDSQGWGFQPGNANPHPSAAFRKLLADPATAPAPAPTPQAEFPLAQSPVVSPFIPSNDSAPPGTDKVCCCRTNSAVYEEPFTIPTPTGCCCGTRADCCTSGGLVNVICGGGHVCGILMLLSALVALMVLSVCITGTFIARRRRAAAAAAAAGGVPGAPLRRPTMPTVSIPDDQIEAMMVRPAPAPATEGADAAAAEPKECPICLDAVGVTPDTWSVFPCSHGCCRPCLNDLLRHSSRRINTNTLALLCPLCRKVAVAPRPPTMSSMDEEAPGSPLALAPFAVPPLPPSPSPPPPPAAPAEAAGATPSGGIWYR